MERLRLMFGHHTIIGIAAGFVAGLVIVARADLPWIRALGLLGIPAQMPNACSLRRFIVHLPRPASSGSSTSRPPDYGHHDAPTNRETFFAPDFVVFPRLVLDFTPVWGLLALLGAA